MQQKATWECDYEVQGTDKVRGWVLTICWYLSILVSSAISVYFVQYTHILNANCEGQSDSQSNGHRVGSLNLKIALVYLICAKYILSIFVLFDMQSWVFFVQKGLFCSPTFYLLSVLLFVHAKSALWECDIVFFLVWCRICIS